MLKLVPKNERIAFHKGAISVLELLQKIGVSKANVEMNLAINKAMKEYVENETTGLE